MRIVYTSDVHSYLFPTTYYEKGERNVGLMRIAESFEKDDDTVVVDGGDTIQGSALSKYVFDRNIRPFPQAQVFKRMGLDIAVPGNHDFNYGYGVFSEFFTETAATILCANLEDRTGRLDIRRHLILEDSSGLRVGFIGAVTDYVNVWERRENLENFVISPVIESVSRELDNIRDCVDYTVLVYHGGFECSLDDGRVLSQTSENQAYEICSKLSFDLVLTAHQHMAIPFRKVGNSYTMQCPSNGAMYACITLSKDGIKGELKTPDENGPHLMERECKSLDDDVQLWLDRTVCSIEAPIPAPTMIDSTSKGSRIADFFNFVQLETTHADISCTSLSNKLYGFENDITIRQVIANYQFPNTLEVVEIGESALRTALERCAQFFDLKDGRIEISRLFLDPKVELYNYDYYMGIEYEFDLRKPVGHRVSKLLFKGEPIGDRVLRLCLNNYRASGTGGYDVLKDLDVVEVYSLDVQDLAVNYLLSHSDNLSWPCSQFSTVY